MSRLEYFFRYNTDIFKNSNEIVKINWKAKQKTNNRVECWELIHKNILRLVVSTFSRRRFPHY
ncbi:hypothetical protein EI989_04635 [Streptococcus suis]|nr:hypothetical protein [Streptococcus suis]RRR36544.1 hypothetical protein EI985_05325 [Streptococcus suis]RRR41122.1 hypothetical protein EI989_04635 [Streptococcus suis]RRR63406.1 hypothetical protein EI991_03900 [Streptococcus suis]